MSQPDAWSTIKSIAVWTAVIKESGHSAQQALVDFSAPAVMEDAGNPAHEIRLPLKNRP
jgi:hypothetical protein